MGLQRKVTLAYILIQFGKFCNIFILFSIFCNILVSFNDLQSLITFTVFLVIGVALILRA